MYLTVCPEVGLSENWLWQVGKELFEDRGTLMNLRGQLSDQFEASGDLAPKIHSRPGQVGCRDSGALLVPE